MKIDLRYAGLTRADERRVRLASSALAAHEFAVDAQAWDGSRGDVLVLDSSELSGAYARARARELGTPTLDLRERADDSAEVVANVVWLTRSLLRILRERIKGEARVSQRDTATETGLGIIELATNPEFSGKPVYAQLRSASVWLLPQAGRVFSTTMSDQLNARARLAHPGWRFEALPNDRNWRPPAEISASLDSFYMEAVWQARDDLPRFPAGQYQLNDWPDLGSAANLVGVLSIVRVLLRQRASLADIARASGQPERDVSACLWALRASGLLPMQPAFTTQPAPRPRDGGRLWSRLAAHFGLARAG